MKDFKAELLFTCEKGMLLLRTSFARTGTQEENSWAWKRTLWLLPSREEEVGGAV